MIRHHNNSILKSEVIADSWRATEKLDIELDVEPIVGEQQKNLKFKEGKLSLASLFIGETND